MSQQRPIVAMHGDSIEGRWYDLVLYGRSIARPMLDAVTMQASSIVELSAVKDTSEWASGMFQFITKTGRLRGALEMKSGHILRIWDYHWPVVLVYVFDNALQTGLPIVLLEEYHYGKDRYADKNGCLVFNSRSEQRVIHCGVGLQQALEWTLQHNTLPE